MPARDHQRQDKRCPRKIPKRPSDAAAKVRRRQILCALHRNSGIHSARDPAINPSGISIAATSAFRSKAAAPTNDGRGRFYSRFEGTKLPDDIHLSVTGESPNLEVRVTRDDEQVTDQHSGER